jgi:hypothetical protein
VSKKPGHHHPDSPVAVLADQHDDWADARRYFSEASMAKLYTRDTDVAVTAELEPHLTATRDRVNAKPHHAAGLIERVRMVCAASGVDVD